MKFTHKIKTLSLASIIASSILLVGCQAQSNTLTFTPQSPSATMNVNQSAVVYVTTEDGRGKSEIANYVKSGELVKLESSPSVTQLFQQVMQQNLISKGFRIGQMNNSNAAVTVKVNNFFAQVDQGNLRYNINTKIQVTAYVQGGKGSFNKNFNATRSQSGALGADNDEIQKVLGETFKDIVNSIYQDQEVGTAIVQYAN